MKIAYYAVFNYDEYDEKEEKYGISILFPDIPEANTCARNYDEGVDMALDVLQLCLYEIEENCLPTPTPLEKIKSGKNEKVVLIQYETENVDVSKFQFLTNRLRIRATLITE